ncbi:MAG: hypothetical protein JXX14_17865 [Deltaproteobacteria bacterium]|nr:hypothetical protein [Deltaproteobacteria bacterium]
MKNELTPLQSEYTTRPQPALTRPNGRPAVFCGVGCGILAVALVNDIPMCIKCLRKKISMVSLKRVHIQPITEAQLEGDVTADASAQLFPFTIELHV